MLSGRPKVFRDPIHRDITYERGPFQKLVVDIVNSGPFQRLRSIRQNGVVNLVFHGAEHSRFGHSMGVAWVAGQMYDAAVRNSGLSPLREAREKTIMAGLLHDLGHGPFSHLLEDILSKKHFDHERFTVRLITEADSEVHGGLAKYSANWERNNPDLDAKYYIGIDEPDRLGYKRYKTDEGPQQSILIADRNGVVEPIENKERSIVSVISTRFVARRLMVPPEIAEEARVIVQERKR